MTPVCTENDPDCVVTIEVLAVVQSLLVQLQVHQ